MIPSIVARQVRETVLDYLRTTFSLSEPDVEKALFDFLDSPRGMFRGSFVDVRLPFRKASKDASLPLDIAPPFRPYQHQLHAFQRLYSRGGHQPQATLVTTGTGSGKTECFLYPILDHCWRERDKPGIKAILLYPMNALASDQARRLAETIWGDARLKGQVRAGLFVGGEGRVQVATRDQLIDSKQVLRQSPPDILLTNYRMLDFLLLRPDDQSLWEQNGPDTLRYLVLDELHTYDGAQGSDVACLIRRLKARLGAGAHSICPVGTSATIGGSDEQSGRQALLRFARDVFGLEFFEDSLVVENRYGIEETLEGEDTFGGPSKASQQDVGLPQPSDTLDPTNSESLEQWVQRQLDAWLPHLPDSLRTPTGVGQVLRGHPFLRQILRAFNGQLRELEEVDVWLTAREEGWAGIKQPQRMRLLESFLGLVSWARRQDPDSQRTEPFLTVQVQLWMRELRHLVREVCANPRFAWETDIARSPQHHLPVALCRSCGISGWATLQLEGESRVRTEPRDIGRAWLQRERSCRFVAPGERNDGELFTAALDTRSLDLWARARESGDTAVPPEGTLPVLVGSDLSDQRPPRFLARCPSCDADGADGLSMLASRAPSLLSVAISHLFQTGYNLDKKLLAFTDSVQDASHRAGFFTARTYRFNLRTAIQGVLEEAAGELPLVGFVDQLLEWTVRRPGYSAARAIATLWPADLVDLGEYQLFLETGDDQEPGLQDVLQARISWELAMEFGHSARVGRTLEKTGCATASVAPAAVEKAARALHLELEEGTLLDRRIAVDERAVCHFLRGLLLRLRVQGGIDHPLLGPYIRNQGAWIHLTKSREPRLSPFGSRSRLPRFLTDRAPHRRQIFQSINTTANRWTWHRDWAVRALGVERKDAGLVGLYREALRRLREAGVVTEHSLAGGQHAWGLSRDAIRLTSDVQRIACAQCQASELVAAGELHRWLDRPCTHYRCGGSWRPAENAGSYYGRRYRSGLVERIFAHEHTGLLERREREDLEREFKSGSRPDAPNLLVTTPTLEMGVDIGDLSATVLCSVPPTTANYLQRIGRAGRKTGNSMCLTVAEAKPHDLYFQAAPLQMMRGHVQPPGCFLDAPEMLRRQFIAYAMDCWARDVDADQAIPRMATAVLNDDQGTRFPGTFLRFYRQRQPAILEAFLRIFGETISAPNRERIREMAGTGNVEAAIGEAFGRIRQEREDISARQRRTRDQIRKIEESPEDFEDPAAEMREQESARALLKRLMDELGRKYPLNVLTDAGVLPNYAFPEPGVTLKAIIREEAGQGDGRRNSSHEYMRPASSAIRELAPWNTFYADGRRHTVSELDLGNRQNRLDSDWRFCADCSHSRRELPDEKAETACPRCGDARWPDAGQLRRLLRFERSRSMQTALESRTNDDGEDRDRSWYQVETLIDVGPENYNGARIIHDLPFGIELLKDLVLREVNFGQLTGAPGDAVLEVAGRPIHSDGFATCTDCGRVQRPDDNRPEHAPWCRSRDRAPESISLYREVRSEAIRVLLPVAEFGRETRLLSFQAALELGFRRRFSGNPQHLQVRLQDEPMPGSTARLRFLVIFDTVPGGTGYLSELWHGDNFRSILQLAHDALTSCRCQQQPTAAAGCYECLYAYQSQKHLALISSLEARNQLREVLDNWGRLEPIDTLSQAELDSRLESELEDYFLDELRKYAESKSLDWREVIRGGEKQWRFRAGGRDWLLQAQRLLDQRDGVSVACRPDFVLRPADGDPSANPVAVFCDGFRFHAMPDAPEGRIHDDVVKRSSILDSGTWLIWSVTWRDVQEFQDRRAQAEVESIFASVSPARLGTFVAQSQLPLAAATASTPTIALLLAYLAHPVRGDWCFFADRALLTWLAEDSSVAPAEARRLEDQLLDSDRLFDAGFGKGETSARTGWLARWHARDSFAALARWQRAELPPTELAGVRLLLRIFDEHRQRRAENFQACWRSFLATWNLAQFLPGCTVLTSEGRGPGSRPAWKADEALKVAEAPPGSPPADYTPGLLPLVEAARALGASDPIETYELMVEGEIVGTAELAWEDLRVALLLEDQLGDAGAFQKAGWATCPDDLESLLALIRQRIQ